MPSLKDIRKRVVSVKNTQKITRAMKLVAAAKLRRAQGAMMELRPYAEKYREMLATLVAATGGDGESAHELLESRDSQGGVAILAISSDRGMCGGFNNAIQKQVLLHSQTMKSEGRAVTVFPLGRRMNQYVGKNDFTVGELFRSGEFDDVVIISNRFRSVIAQIPTLTPLIPAQPGNEDVASSGDVSGDYLYEPGQELLLDHVVPSYVEVQVREAILESIAGEHAARMNAMNSATDNATEMISALTLQMNRARQAAITTELMEIIGGSEALK
jgi:F-type H+-transporting ATPase subunit gamma